jgi:hypothetical protein
MEQYLHVPIHAWHGAHFSPRDNFTLQPTLSPEKKGLVPRTGVDAVGDKGIPVRAENRTTAVQSLYWLMNNRTNFSVAIKGSLLLNLFPARGVICLIQRCFY